MFNWFINISPILQAFIATIFTFSITCLGSGLVFLFKKTNKNIMDAMLGFAGGIMMSASFFSLLNPAIDLSKELKMIPWLVVLIGFLSGGIILFIGDKIFDHFIDKESGFKRMMMLTYSITLHNIPEGLVVGVAFGSLIYNQGTITSAILLALGIGLQNFPEGTAISAPLMRDGMSKFKAFLFGSLSGIVEPISGVIGALLVLKIKILLPFLLAFAAGAMIYVVVEEIVPESQTNERKDVMAMFTIIGFSIMMILDVAL